MTENVNYIVLSRQMAIQRQMDVIANNIANMNTTAYKAERVLFEEYLMKTDDGTQLAYVRDFGNARNLEQGEMRNTLNPLDVAISGDGYFEVQSKDGTVYTRNGHFRVSPDGYLVTASGQRVLDNSGKALAVDPNDPKLDIASDGTVSSSAGPIGTLAVVTFQNEQSMTPMGDGLYKTTAAPTPAANSKILQGFVENANVEPILEMTRMIEASRAYQSTQNILNRDDDIRQQAIDRLGRVS